MIEAEIGYIVQSIVETFYRLVIDDLLPLQTFPFACIYSHESHICYEDDLLQEWFLCIQIIYSRLFSVRWYCLFFWSLRGGDRTYHMGILLYHLQRGSCQHQSTKVGKNIFFCSSLWEWSILHLEIWETIFVLMPASVNQSWKNIHFCSLHR